MDFRLDLLYTRDDDVVGQFGGSLVSKRLQTAADRLDVLYTAPDGSFQLPERRLHRLRLGLPTKQVWRYVGLKQEVLYIQDIPKAPHPQLTLEEIKINN